MKNFLTYQVALEATRQMAGCLVVIKRKDRDLAVPDVRCDVQQGRETLDTARTPCEIHGVDGFL